MNDDKHTCEIYHFDLYGTREYKYEYLNSHDLHSVEWQQLQPQEPQFFFVPKDDSVQNQYEKGFHIEDLFAINTSGVTTGADSTLINDDINTLLNKVSEHYGIIADSDKIKRISYRPLDNRYIYYDSIYVQRARVNVMRHLSGNKNYGLVLMRKQQNIPDFKTVFVSSAMIDKNYYGFQTYVFPLYLYPESGSIDTGRRPNLDEKIWAQINTAIGKEATPEDIFDYIYGILHSPSYRAKYKEFLKVDFPRIPYPKDQSEFEHFRSFGNQLRELHLMHNVPESPVTFPESGSMSVEKVEFSLSGAPCVSAADTLSIAPEFNSGIGSADKPSSVNPEFNSGKVFINATQYFANVPREAWEFYIGGYQPAQKWLKDRKGRTLSFDDIEHYRKIISVLMETKTIMDKIG